MCLRILLFLILSAPTAFATAPEGIPRDFARQRAAQISDVRYHLWFVLTPHAPTVWGQNVIRFKLQAVSPVLLDFRDGTISTLMVNDAAVQVMEENGHLELPAEKLRAGVNTVRIEFTSQVAPAGKAFTRFEDR